MELLNLPRLRNKELQTVGESTIRICKPIEAVKPALEKVELRLGEFKVSMQKDRSAGVSRADWDKKRDTIIHGLLLSVRAEACFDHTDEAQKMVDAMLNIVNKYNGIMRLPYNEQTAATDNMLQEFVKLNLGADAFPEVQRWLPKIEKANNDFKTTSDSVIEDSTRLGNIAAASHIAPQLSEDLQNLYTLMFAYAKIGNDATITDAYAELETLIKSVN